MTDDFLHRIRKEPSPQFLAALKTRLTQIESKPLPPRRWWRQRFFIAAAMAGVALATGLYVTQQAEKAQLASPVSNSTSPLPIQLPNPPVASVTAHGVAPGAPSDSQNRTAHVTATAAPFGIAATVSIYPSVKEATGYVNRIYPPFAEPTLTLLSTEAGIGALCGTDNSIQAVIADRRIAAEELDACRANKKRIAEVKLGYEAIAVVSSDLYTPLKLTSRALFLGLAREVPDPLHPEVLVKNPYVSWDQIDADLPGERIDVSGPPASSAVGLAFRDLVLKAGCITLPTIAALKTTDPERFDEVCGTLRADGYYRANEWFQGTTHSPFNFSGYLQANPEALAVLGYSAGNLKAWGLSAASLDGVVPTIPIIYSGSYPGARTVYLYANTLVPQMRNFAFGLWSAVSSGSDDVILTPVDRAEQRERQQQVLTLPELRL
jgi:phosphate transport system substrate-binding protein